MLNVYKMCFYSEIESMYRASYPVALIWHIRNKQCRVTYLKLPILQHSRMDDNTEELVYEKNSAWVIQNWFGLSKINTVQKAVAKIKFAHWVATQQTFLTTSNKNTKSMLTVKQ